MQQNKASRLRNPYAHYVRVHTCPFERNTHAFDSIFANLRFYCFCCWHDMPLQWLFWFSSLFSAMLEPSHNEEESNNIKPMKCGPPVSVFTYFIMVLFLLHAWWARFCVWFYHTTDKIYLRIKYEIYLPMKYTQTRKFTWTWYKRKWIAKNRLAPYGFYNAIWAYSKSSYMSCIMVPCANDSSVFNWEFLYMSC